MSADPFPIADGAFGRVISPRDLVRGPGLVAGAYLVAATACLSAMLWLLLAGLDLLESRGRVVVPAERAEDFARLIGEDTVETPDDAGPTVATEAGLTHLAWWGRDRPVGAVAALVCRGLPAATANRGALVLLLLTVIPLGAVRAMCLARARRHAERTGRDAVTRLRRSLHRQALRLGPGELVDDVADDVATLFDRDCKEVRRGASVTVERLWRAPLEIVAVAAFVLALHPLSALQIAVPLGAAWLLGRRLRARVAAARETNETAAVGELAVIRDNLRHARLIRGYAMDDAANARFEASLDRYQSGFIELGRTERLERAVARVGVAACLAFAGFVLGAATLSSTLGGSDGGSDGGVTLASALTLLACFVFAARPLEAILDWAETVTPARQAADRIARYLATPPRVAQAVGAKFLQPLAEEITFRDVRYTPPGRAPLIDGLDLTIEAGRTTAVVASDPYATDTLFDLLVRFVEPDEGVISYDGQDIAWVTLESLRAETLRVESGGPVLTATVHENIAAGLPNVTRHQVIEAAKRVRAHSFVQTLDQGYETLVGDGGVRLDVGQRYRLGLARAALRDPAVLIVDEPSAGFDPDTKSFVDAAYKDLFVGRTVVIRPSRLSTIKKADTLVLLHAGKVAAVGSHQELVKTSERYRHWEYVRFNAFDGVEPLSRRA